jgi:hypothetical protein
MWNHGDRVLANRPPEPYWYPGTVRHIDGDRLYVIYDDGEDALLTGEQLMPLKIEVGDRVWARLPAGRTYSLARVVRVDGEQLYLEYDDGEQERSSLGMVRIDRKNWKGRTPQAQSGWIDGDRVLARWGGDFFWYPGTVQGVKGGRVNVCFDDGGRERVAAEHVVKLDLAVGSRVFGRWKGGPAFFPGRITKMEGERIHIQYDDGDQEWTTVSVVRVRRGTGPVPWKVGQRVLAQWGPEPFYYPGVVRSIQDDLLAIQYDDGDRGQVLPEQVLPLDLDVGDVVYARWQGGPYYYPARIERKNADDIFVQYDDGRSEWTTISLVRVLPRPPR